MARAYFENPRLARAEWIEIGARRAAAIKAGVDQVVQAELSFEDPVKPLRKKGVTRGFMGGPRVLFTSPIQYESDDGVRLPPWGGTAVFTFTTKMSCPSFSLPAGPIAIDSPDDIEAGKDPAALQRWWEQTARVSAGGDRRKIFGSCPASVFKNTARLPGLDQFHGPISKAGYTCDRCYAGKGNYKYPNMAVKHMALLSWTEQALDAGTFAPQIVEAIRWMQQPETREVLATKLVSPDFFRIHDAGDFYSEDYYLAWCDVCDALPEVLFWAPTRQWVFPKFRDLFARRLPANLALRPSALSIDSRPPRNLPGQVVDDARELRSARERAYARNPDEPAMSAGTMVNSEAVLPSAEGIYPCPAYESHSEHSCANAPRPDDGGIGCRTCWGAGPRGADRHATEVSYPGH